MPKKKNEMTYPVYTIDTAPPAARNMLLGIQKAFGFVPNMLGTMAAAPAVLEAYQTVGGLFDKTSLSVEERQVVMLTTSAENGCEYCVSVHTALSAMQKVPDDVVRSIRDGATIANPRLEALRQFTAAVVASRGHPAASTLVAIEQAGFSKAQVLEVVLGAGIKTIANYINHVAQTPLDEAFAAVAWTKSVATPSR
jgi:uncharacterized peroxidase-related enzyme